MDIQKLLEEIPNLEQLLRDLPFDHSYDGPMDEHVYDTLSGTLIPECRLPWVEEIMLPGHPYYETYTNARDACKRLLQRLGTGQEDADVEEIFYYLQEHELIMAKKMFEYGRIYEREHNQE